MAIFRELLVISLSVCAIKKHCSYLLGRLAHLSLGRASLYSDHLKVLRLVSLGRLLPVGLRIWSLFLEMFGMLTLVGRVLLQ